MMIEMLKMVAEIWVLMMVGWWLMYSFAAGATKPYNY
jgi:hypothetical protein